MLKHKYPSHLVVKSGKLFGEFNTPLSSRHDYDDIIPLGVSFFPTAM